MVKDGMEHERPTSQYSLSSWYESSNRSYPRIQRAPLTLHQPPISLVLSGSSDLTPSNFLRRRRSLTLQLITVSILRHSFDIVQADALVILGHAMACAMRVATPIAFARH